MAEQQSILTDDEPKSHEADSSINHSATSSPLPGWWKTLGSPRFVVAPMVDQSEAAFRLLCRRYGADLTYTPMLHAKLFSTSSAYRTANFDAVDKPLFAQFCANDAGTLVEAARMVQPHVDAIDLNFGCPQGIARKGHYGAYLLEEPALVCSLVSSLAEEMPVTCKIRKVCGDDPQPTVNLCLDLQARGCKAICIHGRTKEEKSQFTGRCDWDIIRAVKQRLGRMPVIANGGIETYEDAIACLDYTGRGNVRRSRFGVPSVVPRI